MDGTEFVSRFVADEGKSGSRYALRLIDEPSQGVVVGDFNVWNLYIDADNNSLRFDHDFDPYEGTMALSEFVDGLKARLV